MRLFRSWFFVRNFARQAQFLPRCLGLLFGLFVGGAIAEPTFPVLSGSVVDTAHLLSGSVKARLSQSIQAQEQSTGNQVVVVTLESLQGYDIADYGYQLGRHWGIGQAGKNNGVLFIIAPKERKTRIEVGYGLEGELTDALSKQIIDNDVVPHFKAGDFETGIESGAQAILAVLGGSYDSSVRRPATPSPDSPNFGQLFIVVFVFLFIGSLVNTVSGAQASAGVVFAGASLVAWWVASSIGIGLLVGIIAMALHLGNRSSGGGGWSGGGGGGRGGFSGGGGSFGGGGASGSW